MIGQQQLHVDRRLLVAGAGVAGVVVGWVLLMTVFGAGADEVGAGPARPPAPAAAAAAVPRPAPSAPSLTYVPATRDPFRQNATVPRAAAAGQGSVQSPVQGPVQSPVQAAPPVTTRTSTPAGDAGGKASLELKSIGPDASGTVRATITVDGQSYTPAKGESFSHGYRLERIEGNCVEVSAQAARAQMCVPAPKP